jgi:hypothetical protein
MFLTPAVVPAMANHMTYAQPQSYCSCPDCVPVQHSVDFRGYSAAFDSYSVPPFGVPYSKPPQTAVRSYVHNPYSHSPAYCPCDDCVKHALYLNSQVPVQPQVPIHAPIHAAPAPPSSKVSTLQFHQIVGTMVEMAKTAHGSSFIQACLREYNVERFHAVCNEILPRASELLLDTHGCYVVRTLMEQMAKEDLIAFVKRLGKDEEVVIELCTSSLHSRRIIQFLLEKLDSNSCESLIDNVVKKCSEVSRTQQGCIVIQRVLECATPERRKTIFDLVQRNVVSFSMDPYANYVVQYMFEMGDKETNSICVKEYFTGNVVQLACDKYASNVIEKALHFATPEAQHAIVEELYSVGPEKLIAMIQDSYGNYIIQATIALCSFRDVWMIAEFLNPVLHMTPYGYKIASKLERRLKGKALN